jgi:hypothetical protein
MKALVGLLCCLLLGAVSLTLLPPAAADTPLLDNPLLLLVPAVKTMPAPAWLVKGHRMTYDVGTASNTGGKPTGSSQSFEQWDVVGNPGEQVPLLHTGFLRWQGEVFPSMSNAALATPGAGSTWVNPSALTDFPASKTVPATGDMEFLILRGNYNVNGQDYNAITFSYQTTDPNKQDRQDWTYDTVTGLLLHFGYNVVSDEGGQMLIQQKLVQDRQIDVPWAGDATPPAASLDQLSYAGQIGTFVGGRCFPSALSKVAAKTAAGADYCVYTVTTQNAVTGASSATAITGVAQEVSPYWIPPDGLAALTAGQVLDDDPVTHVKLVVDSLGSYKGRPTVFLLRTGLGFQQKAGYDQAKGLLITILLDQKTGTSLSRQILELTTPL